MSDIIEELRNRTTGVILLSDPPQFKKDGLCQQAANEIERLRAENEKLRAELREADVMLLNQARTIRDYQDAAAALKETGDE